MPQHSSSPNIPVRTDGEAVFLAQALDYYRAVTKAGKDAPFGQFLNRADAAAREKGDELIRQSLESITQEAIDEVQKKKETRECPTCQQKTRHLGYREKNIETSTGTIRPKRLYHECGPCDHLENPADAILGLADYTVGLRSLAVYAGADGAFMVAAERLKKLARIELSHMTIRKLCHEEAPKVEKWLAESAEVPKDFIAATGNVELVMDATKVNTTKGWKDMKIGIFSKRLLGEGVEPGYWDKRNKRMLPDVLARIAFASIEEKPLFQQRVNDWRSLLRVGSLGDISALGDGAEWIWNIVHDVFGKVRECLDVYHALEHLSDAGKELYKEGSAEYAGWLEETERELLESGFEEIEKRLDELSKGWENDADKLESLGKLRRYLNNHRTRLCYRERLSEGRVIGSGQVEGACRHMIGKRLKQTGAQWLEERLNEMAALCSAHYSDLWDRYWLQAN